MANESSKDKLDGPHSVDPGDASSPLPYGNAVGELLRTFGPGVLDDPHRFLACMMDLCDPEAPEMRALEHNCDEAVLAPFAEAVRSDDTDAVRDAAARVEWLLQSERMLNEGVSKSVCEGIAEALGAPVPKEATAQMTATMPVAQEVAAQATPLAPAPIRASGPAPSTGVTQTPYATAPMPVTSRAPVSANIASPTDRGGAVGTQRQRTSPALIVAIVIAAMLAAGVGGFLALRSGVGVAAPGSAAEAPTGETSATTTTTTSQATQTQTQTQTPEPAPQEPEPAPEEPEPTPQEPEPAPQAPELRYPDPVRYFTSDTGDGVNVRALPGYGNTIVTEIAEGEVAYYYGDAEPAVCSDGVTRDWLYMETSHGSGWVRGDYVREVSNATTQSDQWAGSVPYMSITGDGVNVRAAPGYGNTILTEVKEGEVAHYYGESEPGVCSDGVTRPWLHLYTTHGDGWVRGDLVSAV